MDVNLTCYLKTEAVDTLVLNCSSLFEHWIFIVKTDNLLINY